jgi:hypothetical protein
VKPPPYLKEKHDDWPDSSERWGKKEIKHEEDHRKKSYMHRKQFIWRNVATMAHSGISSACQALRARIS